MSPFSAIQSFGGTDGFFMISRKGLDMNLVVRTWAARFITLCVKHGSMRCLLIFD